MSENVFRCLYFEMFWLSKVSMALCGKGNIHILAANAGGNGNI